MTTRFIWALRRELWENRWLYVAPACMAAAILVGFTAFTIIQPSEILRLTALRAQSLRMALVASYDGVAGLLMITGLLVGVIYCVDALYGERRDRSILLWKSLPVSDAVTVLAKLCIPVLVLPVIVWMLTVAIQAVMVLITGGILLAHGQAVAELWDKIRVLPSAFTLLYHLVAVHGLLAAPLYGWLLLVSAWAPRAPFMWAFLPPVGVVFLERMALGTMRFANLLLSRLSGSMNDMTPPAAGSTLIDPMALLPPHQFFAAPSLWAGFGITAVFIAAMIRLRRAAQPL